MVKPDRFKETPRKKIFRTTLSASPTYQGPFRHNEPLEEAELENNSTAEELIEEIARERDELDEKRKMQPESASQPRPASPEIRDVAWLIVNRVLRYCKGKEFFIFGLIVTICFALLCIQLALLRKSLHEVGTEQRGDIVNQLIAENEQFKSEILAKIHEVGAEQKEDIVNRLRTENENFKSEVLAKIRDIDEGLKNVKFESHLNAFHNKLLKELKRRDKTVHLDEAPISGEDDGKESLVDDNEEETKNERKETRGWLETIKNVILWLSLFPTLFFFTFFLITGEKKAAS
ncbi:uncharacterized protein PF3D7_1120000-like [Parasteatoda tepidariorum]|uniref:uncharacterized protein PF3D7_1120000-like n=1 Tax=Parasteatoda tepidariorum TaxID=114398 RepID=UPI001C7210AF|nr:uncharacterized protein LOC107443898 [Parasteatoda tepidariorum]